MTRLAVGLFTVLAVCSMGFSDIVRVYKTSDAGGMDVGSGRYYEDPDTRPTGNNGAGSQMRVGKGTQNWGLYDFGSESGMLSTLLADLQHENPAWTSIAAAMVADPEHPKGHIIVRFGVKTAGSQDFAPPLNTKTVKVGLFQSSNAWTEGNGEDQDGSWPSSDLGATCMAASENFDNQLLVPWAVAGVVKLHFKDNMPITYSASSTVLGNFITDQWSYATLGQGVWNPYLASTAAGVGLTTWNNNTGGNDNVTIYTKEQNESSCPVLEISVVPEPATLGLLLVGGVAALIRRRR